MPLVRLLFVFSHAPSLCSSLYSLSSLSLLSVSSPVSPRPRLFSPASLLARTVAVEVHRSDRVGVRGELLQLLPRLHVPDPHRLVEASADDQVRLRVEVDAEDEIEVPHQCFEAEALDTRRRERGRPGGVWGGRGGGRREARNGSGGTGGGVEEGCMVREARTPREAMGGERGGGNRD